MRTMEVSSMFLNGFFIGFDWDLMGFQLNALRALPLATLWFDS